MWLRKNKKNRALPLELVYTRQKARTERRIDVLAKKLLKKACRVHFYFLQRDELLIESWAHYAFLKENISTYGHKTSNIVESINGVWKPF